VGFVYREAIVHCLAAKQFRAHALAFTINLLIGGSQLAHEKGRHRQGHFALAREDGVGASVTQLLQLAKIGGAG
jgi:hypothetical protein